MQVVIPALRREQTCCDVGPAVPLTDAACLPRQGHAEIVSMLLEKGANPDILTTLASETPLHMAAIYGHASVVKALLEGGKCWREPSKSGRSRTACMQHTSESSTYVCNTLASPLAPGCSS
jgi:ankyrin repeat protein